MKSPSSNTKSSCSSEWLAIKSQKSGSSGTKSGVKINVRTTHRQLVWGSVAVGKSVSKSFAVRSEDSCKLAVYVYVEDKLHSYEVLFTLKKDLSNSYTLHFYSVLTYLMIGMLISNLFTITSYCCPIACVPKAEVRWPM